VGGAEIETLRVLPNHSVLSNAIEFRAQASSAKST